MKLGVTFLAMAQTYINGKSVYSALVRPSSQNDKDTTISYYENDSTRAKIITSIHDKFFAGAEYGETRAKLQGYVLIKTGEGSNQVDTSFHVDINMIPLPSSKPSMLPSKSMQPSFIPTSEPSSFLHGLPPHVEVWGECEYLCIIIFYENVHSTQS